MKMEKTIAMEFVTEIPLLLSKGLRRKYLLQYCCYVAIELQRHILQLVKIITNLLHICNEIATKIATVL